jgi:hypothetical protein
LVTVPFTLYSVDQTILKIYIDWKLHTILKWHKHAEKLATTYNITPIYLSFINHIDNQSTLYKVNGIATPNLGYIRVWTLRRNFLK